MYNKSGHSLYQEYNEWSDESKRTRKGDTMRLETKRGYFIETLKWLKRDKNKAAESRLLKDFAKLNTD